MLPRCFSTVRSQSMVRIGPFKQILNEGFFIGGIEREGGGADEWPVRLKGIVFLFVFNLIYKIGYFI